MILCHYDTRCGLEGKFEFGGSFFCHKHLKIAVKEFFQIVQEGGMYEKER